jgi:two-component system, NarL family, response regulator LiaR
MSWEGKKISVLVVEDHRVTLEGLLSGLSKEEGIEVIGHATNSDEGLELARQLQPRVILLDLYLPGATGPKSTVALFSKLPNSEVVVFSGETRTPLVNAILKAGARAYLEKSELISKIAQTIREVATGEHVICDELKSANSNVTRSEEEILKMLARGMKYDEIARMRNSSPATVRKQCDMLLDKLTLNSRERLIAWAVENGYGNLELGA